MKKWILHILLFVSLIGTLATSCSQDDVVQQADDDVINVTFTLMMSDPKSRALDKNVTGREQGNVYENRIDAGGLQVLFYSTDLTICYGKVENISLFKTGASHIYRFVGDLKVSGVSASAPLACKVMVFANCPDVTTTTPLATLEYVYNADRFKNESTNIPMWGVATFGNNGSTDTSLSLIPGEEEDLGTIYLLRSMAKVEVVMSKEAAAEYDLANVTLQGGYHTEGLCLPKNYIEASVTTDMDKSTEMFNVTDDLSSESTDLAFKQVTANSQYVLYLPEYAVTADSKIMVSVLYKDGETGPNLKGKNFIYFKKYTDGATSETAESFNIVRNHYYQYIIRSVKEDAPLNLELTVKPWNLEQKELHYKTEGGAKQTITWNNVGAQPNSQNEVLLGGNNPSSATFSFELSTPTGATWYASLVPVRGDENAFSFSNDSQVTTTVSGAVGQASGDITIYATKTSDIQTNNEARLEIIVMTDDRTINVTDLLGGEYKIMQAKSE